MSYLKHALGKTFYISKGSKKLPLICLHGGPGSGCNYLKPFLNLSQERQVVIYDQLGCGKSSETSPKKWDMKVFVKELDLLAKGLGFEEFFIFGVSCGATLALEYYLKHPKKVKGIIFQSPFFSSKDWRKDALQLINKMDAKNKEILLKTTRGIDVSESDFLSAKRAYYIRHVIRKPKLYDSRKKTKQNSNGRKIYEYMWGKAEHHVSGTLINYERVGFLNRVKVPTLLICGEFDEATPQRGKQYSKLIPHAKFEVIKEASHAIFAEKPKILLNLTSAFLAKIDF